jgi:predicted amidohydrolase
VRILTCNFDPVWNNPEKNIPQILEVLQAMKLESGDLVVFPEASLTGFCVNKPPLGVVEEDPLLAPLQAYIAFHKAHLFLGAFVRSGDELTNSILHFSPDLLAPKRIFSKNNLFTFAGEDLWVTSHSESIPHPVGELRVGMAICFDLRSLKLFGELARRGVDLVVVPASWPSARDDHFETLLKARALDFQVAVLGVNRSGFDPVAGPHSGQSVLVLPNGNRLSSLSEPWGSSFLLTGREIESSKLSFVGGMNV